MKGSVSRDYLCDHGFILSRTRYIDLYRKRFATDTSDLSGGVFGDSLVDICATNSRPPGGKKPG
jgi:hypothetical protein